MDDIVKIVALVAIVAILLFAMYSCAPNASIPGTVNTTESGIEYKQFTVNGMPCLYITEGVGNTKTGGPTCDWSKWRGQ